jgi:hypothetical protein
MVAPCGSTKVLQEEKHVEVCDRCDCASISPGTSRGVEGTFSDAEGEIDLTFLPDG